ncbi:Cyclic di-GMP phosphodiesterase response regulator RpfG [Tepidimonas alkaliphilus]|uniref:Cyclic di-GMP phosphodiesterase response regulator RpfG n=1 Tax=Tepidimonas alkaliphilus TaxID=2588942 RepID=A0A554WB63_9BURK|nr:HD domain-containing phosphohydrolase [Tepidimonas alkaliphilus]TSE20817.1 Cyclic di-GMP phosphodiesterase response regulator RpfG [Tepidimonas alkaliphilus]
MSDAANPANPFDAWAELDAPPRLLLVDDEPANLQLLRRVLEGDYRLSFARSGPEALQRAREVQPRLIVLDVMMPGMTGHDVIRALKADPLTAAIPVLFCTALGADEDEAAGLALGAVDYVTKPISPPVLRARIRTHLALVQRDEVERTRLEVIRRLGRAAEFKDNETGRHVIRMSHTSRLIAEALGAPRRYCETLLAAAPMHDIGKIGVPDAILLKPGKLDETEWAVMRQHPQMGADIIGDDPSPLLQMARTIALQHHEKWDGSGYPHGLKGEAISAEARIVAVADVFDALTNARPYKPAWPRERALAFMQEQSGRHFWPDAVQALLRRLDDIWAVHQTWRDEWPDAHEAS